MKALLSDQETASHETALCEVCFAAIENRAYAREQASQSGDVDPESPFVDCSGNSALNCCICNSDELD